MIYGVFGGCYSGWYIVGFFSNREEANKYCCVFGNGDYYVKPMESLDDVEDLSKVSLKYRHEIVFDLMNREWVMREEPNRYKCYIDDDLRCNCIKANLPNSWVCFAVNIDHDDRKLAEKIAQDYLAELRSYGNGIVYQRNINLMNEKERLRKEAELARLKEKYEK